MGSEQTTRMTGHERLICALEHREPDRVPFDLGGTMVSGINIHALKALRAHLGLEGPGEPADEVTQMGRTQDDLADALKVDVRHVRPMPASQPGLNLARTVKEIEDYPWPDPLDDARYAGMKSRADHVVFNEKRGYVLGRMSSGMWEHAMWMRGYEQFFMDMALDQKMVHAIMTKILEIKTQYWGKALDTVGENVMVISCADDLGAQDSLLVSLDMYRKLIWPYHKKLFDFIKTRAKSKVYIFFHNDGAIYETLPLLIEAGVDILNPWQVNCRGMDDTAKFKREFGGDLTIWGGSCDTQEVLPFGTPREVRDETRRRIEDLAPGGGFVFAPIHVIQGAVPVQNIIAWWETLQEYGVYG